MLDIAFKHGLFNVGIIFKDINDFGNQIIDVSVKNKLYPDTTDHASFVIPSFNKVNNTIVYNNSVYADVIYGIPPVSKLLTYISGIDVFQQPKGSKIGSLVSIDTPPGNDATSIIMKSCYGDVSFNQMLEIDKQNAASIYNLDSWQYCRVSDIMLVALKAIVLNEITNTTDGRLHLFSLKSSILNVLNMAKYISHVSAINDWLVKEQSSSVYISPIFVNKPLDVINMIQTTALDVTNTSQTKPLVRFGLKNNYSL